MAIRPRGVVFLVGAPRSGTTWLQSLLGAHPNVVTPQETDLFSAYVSPLRAAWDWQTRGEPEDWARRRYKGVPAVLTRDRFDELVHGLAESVLEAAAALKPAATVLVEKSPAHSLHTQLVRDMQPEARFLHLIRDGRDVTASLVAAGKGWGSSWAPTSVRDGASTWAEHVRGAQRAASAGEGYREVRYEDLRTGEPELLAELFEFCQVTATVENCRQLIDRMSMERMAKGVEASPLLIGGEFADVAAARKEPDGFFGRGQAGGWRQTWGPLDRRIFNAVAGDLLGELGYAGDRSWFEDEGRSSRGWDVAAAGVSGLQRVLHGLSRRANRWASRLP